VIPPQWPTSMKAQKYNQSEVNTVQSEMKFHNSHNNSIDNVI
jgi:hypothetical protein